MYKYIISLMLILTHLSLIGQVKSASLEYSENIQYKKGECVSFVFDWDNDLIQKVRFTTEGKDQCDVMHMSKIKSYFYNNELTYKVESVGENIKLSHSVKSLCDNDVIITIHIEVMNSELKP